MRSVMGISAFWYNASWMVQYVQSVVGSYKVNAFLFRKNNPHIHDQIFNVEFPEQFCFVKVIGPL